MIRQLATSNGGRWVVARSGRALRIYGQDSRREVELAHDDIDLAFIGSPEVLVEIARVGSKTVVSLRDVPTLDVVAKLELEQPTRLAAITGTRLALAAPDARHVAIVRVAAKALAQQAIDVAAPFEFVVGLDRDQLLFGLAKELKIWDAVAARPLVKLQLQLPPAPRMVGVAAGHVWAARANSDEIFLYRLSDGRPFQHRVGAVIEQVISHPGSPVLVLVTANGLARLHCLAHTVTPIERVAWTASDPAALAQLVFGPDEISLLGLAAGEAPPWHVPIAGTGGRVAALFAPPAEPTPVTKPSPAAPMVFAAAVPAPGPARAIAAPVVAWRDALATYGDLLLGGRHVAVPALPAQGQLGELVARLGLGEPAQRALLALYALYLVGEPSISIARLAHALEDWHEALGTGELSALAMLRRRDGRVSLRTAVSDLLDGAAPRAVRLVGDAPATPRPGAYRVARDSRTDAEIEAELVGKLGRIAIAHGKLPRALLESRLHGATAVVLSPPGKRPAPWPRGAGLVLVLYGTESAWIADVPALDGAAPTAS